MDDRTLVATPSGGTLPSLGAESAGERTQMGTSVRCPVCETENAPGETWCGECGFRLDAMPGEAFEPVRDGGSARLVDSQGIAFTLREGTQSVGRQDTDLLIHDPAVSRRHAQIEVAEGAIWVEDLGSSNGTFVNEERLGPGDRRPLYGGDAVRFGSRKLTVEVELPPGDVANGSEETRDDGLRPEDEAAGAEAPDPMVPDLVSGPPSDPGELVGPALVLPNDELFVLPEGSVRVGRRAENDLVLPDAFTSGAHAEIVREGISAFVVDRSSTNGTFLNGSRLTPGARAPLKEGDVVTFGKTQVTFRQPPQGS